MSHINHRQPRWHDGRGSLSVSPLTYSWEIH